MSENQEPIQEQPKTRVTRITMGRVYNLGNYENQRVEISVDISNGDDPANVFKNIEGILGNLRAKSGVDTYEIARARRILSVPESELDEDDQKRLPRAKEVMEKLEQAKARREAARAALSMIDHSFEHKDHKLDWQDEDGDYYE